MRLLTEARSEYEGTVGVQYFDTTFSVDKTISLARASALASAVEAQQAGDPKVAAEWEERAAGSARWPLHGNGQARTATLVTAGSGFGLFLGAAVTAFYAQKTFASQSEELREQRDFNRRQVQFNERQLKISRTQQVLAQEAERRQRTPWFRADVLTRNDGSILMYLHLRLLSETLSTGSTLSCSIGSMGSQSTVRYVLHPRNGASACGPETALLPGMAPSDIRRQGCVTALGGPPIRWSQSGRGRWTATLDIDLPLASAPD